MIKYSTKRLLQSIVTVLLIVTIVFLLMRMLSTDYYFTEEQLMKFTEEQKIVSCRITRSYTKTTARFLWEIGSF